VGTKTLAYTIVKFNAVPPEHKDGQFAAFLLYNVDGSYDQNFQL
jgi:hypothetical protein